MEINPTLLRILEYIITGSVGGGIFSLIATWLGKRKDRLDRLQSEAQAKKTDSEAEKTASEAEQIRTQSTNDIIQTLREEIKRYHDETEKARKELDTTKAKLDTVIHELMILQKQYDVISLQKISSDNEIARLNAVILTLQGKVEELTSENLTLREKVDILEKTNGNGKEH